jgi:ParB-like nuclease domain
MKRSLTFLTEALRPTQAKVDKAVRDATFILDVDIDDIDWVLEEVPINKIEVRETGKRYGTDALIAAYEHDPAGPTPIVVDSHGSRRTYRLLDGHHRFRSARAAGLTKIWAVRVTEVTKAGSRTECVCGHARHMHNGMLRFGPPEDCVEPGCNCQKFREAKR